MDIDVPVAPVPAPTVLPARTAAPVCDVVGCKVPRKYRLVKDWKRGACGMEHLKVLESQLVT